MNGEYKGVSEWAEDLMVRMGELEERMEVINAKRIELGLDA